MQIVTVQLLIWALEHNPLVIGYSETCLHGALCFAHQIMPFFPLMLTLRAVLRGSS